MLADSKILIVNYATRDENRLLLREDDDWARGEVEGAENARD